MVRWKNISAVELVKYVYNTRYIIIDLRSRELYRAGHVQRALNLPFEGEYGGIMELAAKGVPILYCERGGTSIKVSRFLTQRGIECINVIGGYEAYILAQKHRF